MIKKIITLPTNDSKIYKQILAFLNFMLELTPQEREVLSELIKLNHEYEALPKEKRAKFILSTDIRKETRELLEIEEKQFNGIISRLKKKTFLGQPIMDDKNLIHSELLFKPDKEGFKIEITLKNMGKPKKIEKKVEVEIKKEPEVIVEKPIKKPAKKVKPQGPVIVGSRK
jgi:hypothetical protein